MLLASNVFLILFQFNALAQRLRVKSTVASTAGRQIVGMTFEMSLHFIERCGVFITKHCCDAHDTVDVIGTLVAVFGTMLPTVVGTFDPEVICGETSGPCGRWHLHQVGVSTWDLHQVVCCSLHRSQVRCRSTNLFPHEKFAGGTWQMAFFFRTYVCCRLIWCA